MERDLENIIKLGKVKESRAAQKVALKHYIGRINDSEDIDNINILKNNLVLKVLLYKENLERINTKNYIFENGEVAHIIGLKLNEGTLLLTITDDLYYKKLKK